jgi:hypothetical protein
MTAKRAMDKSRLLEILETYGAEPSRWPAAERAAGEALLAQTPGLAAERKAALGLDKLLSAAPAGEVSPALRARIYEQAAQAVAAPVARIETGKSGLERLGAMLADVFRLPDTSGGLMAFARPISAALLAVAIGLGAGASLPMSASSPPSEVDYLAAMWATPGLAQDVGDLNGQ